MLNWPRNGGCIRTQPTKLKRRTVSYAFFTREVAHRCSCNIEITRSFDRTARPRNLCYSRARNESFSTRRKRGGSEKEEEKFNFRSPRNLFKRERNLSSRILGSTFFASPFQFIASGNDSPSDPSSTVFLFFYSISLPKESSRDRGFVVHAA